MINPCRFVLAASFAIALCACSSEATYTAADAQASLDAQNYFAARDQAKAALREDGGDAAALTVLVRAQLAMGQGGDARASLMRLEALGPLPQDAPLLAAEASLQLGEIARMRAELDGQESADAWRLRALGAAFEEDEAGALAAFASGRTAQGDRVKLYVAEASYHLMRFNAAPAREPVRLAQQAGAGRVETYFVTARLAQLDGDPELASRAFLAILDKSPNDRPALLGAIAELGKMERIDLLRPLIARGKAAYPSDQEFTYLTARLKAEDGDWKSVREILQKNESELADHPDSRGLYGEALYQLGHYEMARVQLAPLHRSQPENTQVTRAYAKVLLSTGDKARAREVIAPLAAAPDALAEDVELAARAGLS